MSHDGGLKCHDGATFLEGSLDLLSHDQAVVLSC
jgi:hypothetical protein